MNERTASVKELFRTSEAGKYENLRRLLLNHKFSQEIIDVAIRKCINNYNKNNNNYEESIKLLFSNGDLNYNNPNENNSNILMILCWKGNNLIISKLLDGQYLQKKLPIEIDLFKVDNNKYNILHYLIKSEFNQELEAMTIFEKFMNYNININQKKNNKNVELLSQPNNKGITPLILILQRGWTNFLKKYLEYVDYKKYIFPLTNNNLIHYAIDSKKIGCLKIILKYSTSEDILYCNKEGYSPSVYAKIKNYNYMSKLIEETGKYYEYAELKNIIISPFTPLAQILEDFMNKKYDITLYYFIQYKSLFSLIENKINCSFEWNKYIAECYNIINMNDEKKYLKEKTNLIYYINEFLKFFNKNLNENKINSHINEISYNFDILIYNKIIFYIKINDWDSAIKNINLFFNSIIFPINNNIKKFLFINITLILIEYFIETNNEMMSFFSLESLERFLKLNNNSEKDINYTFINEELISKYLHGKELFYFIKSFSNDIYMYLHLLKSYSTIKYKILSKYYNNNIHDVNNINIRTLFKDFKKRLNKNKNDKTLPLIDKIKIIYPIIKSKLYFLINNPHKSISKIAKIKQSNYYNSFEYTIYYYNSMGIINLYLKKYNLSKYYFNLGIQLFEMVSNNKKNIIKKYIMKDQPISLINRLDFLYKLKFNLGLCLFYQNKFKESYDIFENLIKIPMFQNNIYLLYRYGLCALHLYVLSLRKKANEKTSIFWVNEIKNAQRKKQNNDKVEIDNIFIYRSGSFNNNANDDLFNQFEEEYGLKKENDNIHSLQSSKVFFLNRRNNNRTTFNLNLIYLQQSIKIFKKIINIFKFQKTININKQQKKEKEKNNELKKIYLFYKNNINNNINKNFNESKLENGDIKIPKNIFLSTFLNLLFAYSLQSKWFDILLEIKWFKRINKTSYFNIQKDDFSIKLNYYKLLSLVNLNDINKTKNFINTDLKRNNFNFNKIYEFFNCNNGKLEKNISYKNYLSCAEILIECKEKRFSDAEIKAKNLLLEYLYKYKELPKYYFEIYIYTLLQQNKIQQTLSLIKYKKANDIK